eukprot:COSAG03_NODE_9982_length_680_cov_1.127367_1_plen_129_part_00
MKNVVDYFKMTLRDKCLAAALRRQTNGDSSWMFGLDDIATHRRREQLQFAALSRLVLTSDCAQPTEPKRTAPPFLPFTFAATTNRETLYAQKKYWDAQLKQEWDRERKLRLDREEAEYVARSKRTNNM